MSKKILSAIFILLAFMGQAFAQSQDFTDVSTSHPNYNAIFLLRSDGIINGYPDNTFHPDSPISRVEALKMIFVAGKIDVTPGIGPAKFTDIALNEWYTPFLNKAAYLEIVNGYPDGTFRPAQTVSKTEFLKMLILTNQVNLADLIMKELPYADAEPGQWYSKYLMYAKFFSLLDADSENKIFPSGPLTRAQAAELIYRFGKITEADRLHPVLANTSDQMTYSGITASTSTSVTAPINLIPGFALFVSDSGHFAIQYPKIWFYQIAENNIVDPNDPFYSSILKTYYFGPKDLALNPPEVILEIVSSTGTFVGDAIYNEVPYYKTTASDGQMVIISSPKDSNKLYRFTGPEADLQRILDMISTLTENTTGLQSYFPVS